MKFKFLIVAGLILAIMTAGVACASENVTSDDQLALDENSDIEAAVEEDVLGDSPTRDDFEVDFSEITAVNSKYDVITVYEHTEDGVHGNLTVSVDGGEPVYNKEFKYEAYVNITDLGITTPGIYAIRANFIPVGESPILLLDKNLNVTEREGYGDLTAYIYNANYNPDHEIEDDLLVDVSERPSNGTVLVYINGTLQYNGTGYSIYLSNMKEKLSIGRHYVSVRWWNGNNETTIRSRIVNIGYNFGLDNDAYDTTFYLGKDAKFLICLPYDATGDVYVTFNGKTEEIPHKNGKAYIEYTIKTSSLKLKKYKFHMELRNDPFYPAETYETEIEMIPEITYNDLAVGETGYVSIFLPKNFKGTFKLYNTKHDEKTGKAIKSVAVKNGRADIPLSYSKTGSKTLLAEYVNGKNTYSFYFSFDIKKNDKKISASVNAKTIKANNKVTVKIKSPAGYANPFYIYVDGKYYKTVNLKNGQKKVSIPFKTTGTHLIKVMRNWNEKFYSNTFKIKVKKADVQLTLKKASVKKSAKKLTIKSTLKIKGKAKKGLKIKFKFNEKKYTAKTNKKGVAKITIKKSVLKKLKVGQTIKYQASYGKTVVKKSAQVKD